MCRCPVVLTAGWGGDGVRWCTAAVAANRKEDLGPQHPSNGHKATGIQFMNLISRQEQLATAFNVGWLYLQMVLNVGQTNILREKEKNPFYLEY